jgi:hypothetical protein
MSGAATDISLKFYKTLDTDKIKAIANIDQIRYEVAAAILKR